jgi:hypothetical protein
MILSIYPDMLIHHAICKTCLTVLTNPRGHCSTSIFTGRIQCKLHNDNSAVDTLTMSFEFHYTDPLNWIMLVNSAELTLVREHSSAKL